jgi:hypothetical protein
LSRLLLLTITITRYLRYPVVSGVVALMLEANPDLGWRDVQDILARSAKYVNDPDDPTFAINSANISHSNKYGFGIVNADLAVNMSISHTNLGPERMLLGKGSGNVPIFDHKEGKTTVANVTIDSGLPFETENVYVYLRLNHTSRGHLQIVLKSPGMYADACTCPSSPSLLFYLMFVIATLSSHISFAITSSSSVTFQLSCYRGYGIGTNSGIPSRGSNW